MSLRRQAHSFFKFFFAEGQAISIVVAFVLGNEIDRFAEVYVSELLMPLLNPFVKSGSWKDINVNFYGGPIQIGLLIDTTLQLVIVVLFLFFVIKLARKAAIADSRLDNY